MTLELPLFRLGLAGFSTRQEEELAAVLAGGASGVMVWQLGKMPDSDAWWVNGSSVRWLGDSSISVAAGHALAQPLQLDLPDVDRPIAFSLPLACAEFQPAYSFEVASRPSIVAVLGKFEAWLSPLAAQFCLASHIVEHQTALGSGSFRIRLNGNPLAVVNMPGEIGVVPGAGPADFEEAVWTRASSPIEIPENFTRTSLSQLMWQYAVRTQRDVLPPHYRTDVLYYRRPPRLPQSAVMDSHLLLMRELAGAPADFETLLQRCGFDAQRLARDLAALYFVGSITSNRKRAAGYPRRRRAGEREPAQSLHSSLPSSLDPEPPSPSVREALSWGDLTAPAALGPASGRRE